MRALPYRQPVPYSSQTKQTRGFARFLLFVFAALCLGACSPIFYIEPGTSEKAPAGDSEYREGQLKSLRKILEKYGKVLPEEGQPGFWAQSPDYSIRARLVDGGEVDVAVYWKPGRECKLLLPLVIADIKSQMAEVLQGSYCLTPKNE